MDRINTEKKKRYSIELFLQKKNKKCSSIVYVFCSFCVFLPTNPKQIQLDRSMTIITKFITTTTFGRYFYIQYLYSYVVRILISTMMQCQIEVQEKEYIYIYIIVELHSVYLPFFLYKMYMDIYINVCILYTLKAETFLIHFVFFFLCLY